MGLYDRLINNGSTYTLYDGNIPPINLLATRYSPLHAFSDPLGNEFIPGYSLIGFDSLGYTQTFLSWQEYNYDPSNLFPPILPDQTSLEPDDEGMLAPSYQTPFSPKTGKRYQDIIF